MENNEILDVAYLTIEDFLNNKSTRSDLVNHNRSLDEIELHFNKPGFDMAFIITDMSLISSISDLQCEFQTNFGFTTHTIYLPDISRLKFCIKDLKLLEILYVAVVTERSKSEDEYDVYVLSECIELQRELRHEEMVTWIRNDLENYMDQVRTVLVRPGPSIHSNNAIMCGAFIEPDNDIRYFLCLLLDYRMLEMHELVALSAFIGRRKAAIEQLGNVTINYGINSRPIPPYRKDKLKYYIYEYHGGKNEVVDQPKKKEYNDCKVAPTINGGGPELSDSSMIPGRSTTIQEPSLSAMSPPIAVQAKIDTIKTTDNVSRPSPILEGVSSPRHKSPISNGHTINRSMSQTSVRGNMTVQPLMDIQLPSEAEIHPPVVMIPPQPQMNVQMLRSPPPPPPSPSPALLPLPQQHHVRMPPNVIAMPHYGGRIRPQGPMNQRPVNMCHPHVQTAHRMPNSNTQSPSWIDRIAAVCQANPAIQSNSTPIAKVTPHTSPDKPITTSPAVSRSTPQSPMVTKNSQLQSASVSTPQSPANKTTATINQSQKSPDAPSIISNVVQSWVDQFVLETQEILVTSNNTAPSVVKTTQSNPPPLKRGSCASNFAMDYHLSPISNDSDDIANNNDSIDLTNDLPECSDPQSPPPPKRRKCAPSEGSVSTAPSQDTLSITPTQCAVSIVDPVVCSKITTSVAQKSSVNSTTCKVTCRTMMSFMKFALVLSPLPLPIQNGVMALVKKCLDDIERHTVYCGLKPISVDVRQCRSEGLSESMSIIEALTGDTVPHGYVVSDLKFMWSYFPQKLTDDSIIVLFYKIIKVLEQCKLDNTSNDILVGALQKIQQLVTFNFQLTELRPQPPSIMNFFPSLFPEYFDLRADLHNLALPSQEPVTVTFNADHDKLVMEHRIKFMVGPLLEFFIGRINSIHYQLEPEKMEVLYGSMRAMRFCLRKMCVRLVPEPVPPLAAFSSEDTVMDRTLAIIDEINYLLREVTMLNCLLFTKKHYEFVNLILDFSLKIDSLVMDGADPDMDLPVQDYLIHLEPSQFLQDFSTTIKTAVLPYHHDSEIDVFKRALKNRWTDTLHQAFKGVPPAPDGGRIYAELTYLLPKCWSKPTYNEAVVEAASLSLNDWDRMLTNDFARARGTYNDVRNNYLTWLSVHNLDHRKAVEQMTAHQKKIDAKILLLSA